MSYVDPKHYGVTFSLKQCRSFDIDPVKTLDWLLKDAGFQRFRLMTYWNEHEKVRGTYDFSRLDAQVDQIEAAGGVITMCLGVRQPRWPENHWTDWAWQLPKPERSEAILAYVEAAVEHFKDRKGIISWQLENEALLKRWGDRAEVNRPRLRAEYKLVKRIDPSRPVIMTTSTSWGIPIRRPIPDIVGFSYYRTIYRDGGYHESLFSPAVHRVRKFLIKILHFKPVFIHELQCEPWGPTAIWKMSSEEQAKSMSPERIAENIRLARQINADPIDLWGGEWWYWRLQQGDSSIWDAVHDAVQDAVQ